MLGQMQMTNFSTQERTRSERQYAPEDVACSWDLQEGHSEARNMRFETISYGRASHDQQNHN